MIVQKLLQENRFVCLLVLLILVAVICIIFLFNQQKPYLIRPWTGVVSIVVVTCCLVVAFASVFCGKVYVKTDGYPRGVVETFYDSIINRDYEQAYECLQGIDTLGLELQSTTEEGRMLQEALMDSYQYALLGETMVDELHANQTVSFTYLNTEKVLENAQGRIGTILEEWVQSKPRDTVFDEEGEYRQKILTQVYQQALSDSLQQKDSFMETVTYDVQLDYISNEWKLQTNETMIRCLQGL